jgi:glyoxylase-like metal-dependent hydrolase (beta-lactamase superfamily II)
VTSAEIAIGVVAEPFYGENAYIVHWRGRSDCLVVDPSFEFNGLVDYMNKHELKPAAILNTHGHADHIAGNGPMKQQWPDCPLIIGKGDAVKLTDPVANLSRPFGMDILSPPADREIEEGEQVTFAGFELEVLETPGHSAGHVVFVCKQCSPFVVLGGDVLFRRGVGRTDFPDGDTNQLMSSIRDKLYLLPDDTVVLPGHGDSTTIGEEKRENPFVAASE